MPTIPVPTTTTFRLLPTIAASLPFLFGCMSFPLEAARFGQCSPRANHRSSMGKISLPYSVLLLL